jgi:hypothetical protein
MFCAEWRAAAAIGTAAKTRSGNRRRPGQHLHAAHRAADDAEQLRNAEMVDQQCLGPHHVGDGDHREAQAPGPAGAGLRVARPGGAHAAAEHVAADHEIAAGVERQAVAHHALPPARLAGHRMALGDELVAGQGMADQDGVGTLVVEPAIGLPGDGEGPERDAAIERQRRRHAEGGAMAGKVAGRAGAVSLQRGHGRSRSPAS